MSATSLTPEQTQNIIKKLKELDAQFFDSLSRTETKEFDDLLRSVIDREIQRIVKARRDEVVGAFFSESSDAVLDQSTSETLEKRVFNACIDVTSECKTRIDAWRSDKQEDDDEAEADEAPATTVEPIVIRHPFVYIGCALASVLTWAVVFCTAMNYNAPEWARLALIATTIAMLYVAVRASQIYRCKQLDVNTSWLSVPTKSGWPLIATIVFAYVGTVTYVVLRPNSGVFKSFETVFNGGSADAQGTGANAATVTLTAFIFMFYVALSFYHQTIQVTPQSAGCA